MLGLNIADQCPEKQEELSQILGIVLFSIFTCQMARRSGRERKATFKASEIHNVERVLGSPEPGLVERDGGSTEDEYNEQQSVRDEEQDDLMSDAGGPASQSSAVVSEQEENDSDLLPELPIKRRRRVEPAAKKPPIGRVVPATSTAGRQSLHSRGVFHAYSHTRKDRTYPWVMGENPKLRGWLFRTLEPCFNEYALPLRRNVKDPGQSTQGLRAQPPRTDTAKSEAELDWNHRIGSKSHALQNNTARFEDLVPFIEACKTKIQRHIITPGSPAPTEMKPADALSLASIFSNVPLAEAVRNDSRRGWLICAEGEVRCLSWLPNNSSSTQYLAVGIYPEQSPDTTLMYSSSVFAPSDLGPAFVHIWRFKGSTVNKKGQMTIQNTVKPRVETIIHCEAGCPTQLKWCSVPQQKSQLSSGPDQNYIGLLAMLSRDGVARVMSVESNSKQDADQSNSMTDCGAIELRPEHTVCTCMTWVSNSLLAAGCANGFVVIWDLAQVMHDQRLENITPVFIHCVHTTFIKEITTGSPSHSHILISSSVDGHIYVTDIRDPTSDTAHTLRSRTPFIGLEWLDQGLSVICADDNNFLKGASLRALDHFTSIARFENPINSIASSLAHSSVLVGCTDGSVSTLNGLHGLFHDRYDERQRQTWFKCEWRPAQPVLSENRSSTGDGSHSMVYDFPGGLCRISTGFRSESILEDNRARSKSSQEKNRKKPPGTADIAAYSAIVFERESMITALAWNPNLETCGWAAAGTSHGLLMIEDLLQD